MPHRSPHTPPPVLPTSTDAPRALGLPGLEPAIKLRGWPSISAAAFALREHAPPLYAYAQARRDATGPTIARLARLLNCSADQLLGLAPVVDPPAVDAATAAAAAALK